MGDVNGDGLYDLLCHDANGRTTLMFNQGGMRGVNTIFSGFVYNLCIYCSYHWLVYFSLFFDPLSDSVK